MIRSISLFVPFSVSIVVFKFVFASIQRHQVEETETEMMEIWEEAV